MKKSPLKHQKSAIRLIEQTFHILRSAPGRLLSVYYIGGVPFVLGLLYFWADMSRSAEAHQYSAMASFGLAFLFVWMKFWQTVFMYQVRAQLFDEARTAWTRQRVISIFVIQSLVHSTRLFVLLIASLMIIPFGFCYAFYQNVSAHDDEHGQTVRSTCQWAWRQARLWPRQNHLLIGIYWLFGFVMFINIAVSAVVIPQTIKTLFGINSAFTLSGIYMVLNTTFWISVLGVTYLLLDPFIKATYALRCFYGSALQSGDDLKSELKQVQTSRRNLAAGLLILSICAMPLISIAGPKTTVSPAELDRSIEETMGRREFTWRMPRESVQSTAAEDKGPLETAVEWLIEMVQRGLKKIGSWIKIVIEWLEGKLPEPDWKPDTSSGSWITPVRAALLMLIVLLLAILVFVFVRIWKRRQPAPVEAVSAVAVRTPDLTDEHIKADDLSSNRWLDLAAEFVEKGDLRLAMRALYLATLAHLADQEMITIDLYKSNREYERELKRRAHGHKELLSIFAGSLNLFERVWYGMHRIARTDFNLFAANQRRMMAFAEK